MESHKRSSSLAVWHIALLTLVGVIFFWFFPLKLIVRLAARYGRASKYRSSLSWLVHNPIRRWYMRNILDGVGVKPGETVLELGCGPRALTIQAAQRLGPAGKLIVVDKSPYRIAQAERRVHQAGLTNVEFRAADPYHLPIDDESVDRVMLVTVLPEIDDQAHALAELRRVLKPAGLLSITEEFIDPDYQFPREMARLAQAAGFSPERKTGSFWVYTLNFWKGEGIAYG